MPLHVVVPILRIFDEAVARRHYVNYLGFAVDWTHRFGDNFPIYLQISRDDVVIHLSEHHGDATPGSRIRILVSDLTDLHRDLTGKDYKYAKPGLKDTEFGEQQVEIHDPFGNCITFFEKR